MIFEIGNNKLYFNNLKLVVPLCLLQLIVRNSHDHWHCNFILHLSCI